MEFFYFTRAAPSTTTGGAGEAERSIGGGARFRSNRGTRGGAVRYSGRSDFERFVAAAVEEAFQEARSRPKKADAVPAADIVDISDAALRVLGGMPILNLAGNALATRLAREAVSRYEPAEIVNFLAVVPPWAPIAVVDDDEEALAVLLLS